MTLVEVLLAITICAVALAAMGNVIAASNGSADKGNCYNIATQIASDDIITFENTAFDQIAEVTTTSTFTRTGANLTEIEPMLPSGVTMTETDTIGPLGGNSSNTDILQCDIVVTWTTSGNAQASGQVKMSTLLSNS
jgi:hypothetical protein